MRLKRIKIENIRSYEEQVVEFHSGSTLLCGDIGSGKTSILMAIEFAFFGLQPGQRGHALLRNGEDTGKVIMDLEVDGEEVSIERTLKRGRTVSQDYCAIIINGEKREMSVSELKSKVLGLLNYPGEFAKKQNLLYKFTVYTPQEEMKEIILEDAETRINTLRHIFSIDKYKRITDNASLLASKLREEKRLKEALTEDLEEERSVVIAKERNLEEKSALLSSAQSRLALRKEERKKKELEKEELVKKIEEKNKFKQEVEKTNIMITNKDNAIIDNERLITALKNQVQEVQVAQTDNDALPKVEQELRVLQQDSSAIDDEILTLTKRVYSLEMKNEENKKVIDTLKDLETCPTCLQQVEAIYKSHVKNNLDNLSSKNHGEIQNLQEKKGIAEEKNKHLKEKMDTLKKKIEELKFFFLKKEQLKEKEERVEDLEKLNLALKKDIDLLKSHNDSLKSFISDFTKYERFLLTKNEELSVALKEEKDEEIRAAELKKEIEVFSIQIQDLKERISSKEEMKKKLQYITNLEMWINKKFSAMISMIEKNVMVKLKREFSELFSQWFSILVTDTLSVKLSDDFTPIVEQDDYELDYGYLSGGERTAVALAYRLALNQVINSLLSQIKTKDFLILDEPTDGFSDQQLDKIRDIFQELNIGQLIVVSHEQKIEGFVEHIVRFKKDHWISSRA